MSPTEFGVCVAIVLAVNGWYFLARSARRTREREDASLVAMKAEQERRREEGITYAAMAHQAMGEMLADARLLATAPLNRHVAAEVNERQRERMTRYEFMTGRPHHFFDAA